jgi:agmatine/peptidylarginine deiminase
VASWWPARACWFRPLSDAHATRNSCHGHQAHNLAELKRLLGLTHIIWLPGIKGRDITDGHTDFYARFASPGSTLHAGNQQFPCTLGPGKVSFFQ